MIKKETFTIDSRDGKTKLYAAAWVPETDPICILQIIHGMDGTIERYEEMAQYMAERGILVVGDDHLGHGKSVPEGDQKGYFCEHDASTVLVRDEHRLKKTMQQRYPTLPYIILGHSLGSFMLRNYLIRYGSGIQGAVICATGSPKRSKLILGKTYAAIVKAICGDHRVSRLLGSRVAARTGGGMVTYTVNAYYAIFDLMLKMQDEKEMEKMPKKLPILIVSGADDAVGEFGRAPQRLYDDMLNLDMTKVRCKLYSGCGHDIFGEPIRESAYVDLYNFISAVAENL